MLVRPLRAEEWPLLRELRLRALADAPASSRPATTSRSHPAPS